MKKFFLALFFCITSALAHANSVDDSFRSPIPVASCVAQVPYGQPVVAHKLDSTTLCRRAYILEHDNAAKIPAWVAYTLTRDHTVGCVKRGDNFDEDGSLKYGKRAEISDYRRSGYDKGHIANSADMSWNPSVQRQSFLLSNMAPQIHAFNAGIWKELETNIRAWAYNRDSTLLIYAGPVYGGRDKTIGANKVVVPHGFYKIVVDTETNETMAFLFPHEDAEATDLKPFLTSVAVIEKKTGITFPVPSDKTAVSTLWANNLKPVAKEKKLVCQR